MNNVCKCRSAQIAKKYRYNAGECIQTTTDFKCIMCDDNNKKFNLHTDGKGTFSDALECSNCHNYIRYLDQNSKKLEKDEFYFDDFFIIYEDLKYYYYEYAENNVYLDRFIAGFPAFSFKDKDDLLNKVKVFITFS